MALGQDRPGLVRLVNPMRCNLRAWALAFAMMSTLAAASLGAPPAVAEGPPSVSIESPAERGVYVNGERRGTGPISGPGVDAEILGVLTIEAKYACPHAGDRAVLTLFFDGEFVADFPKGGPAGGTNPPSGTVWFRNVKPPSSGIVEIAVLLTCYHPTPQGLQIESNTTAYRTVLWVV